MGLVLHSDLRMGAGFMSLLQELNALPSHLKQLCQFPSTSSPIHVADAGEICAKCLFPFKLCLDNVSNLQKPWCSKITGRKVALWGAGNPSWHQGITD